MSLLHAIFLGIVQGLTEFLPVSSSAHLKLGRLLFGLEANVNFDLACHLGTLAALLIFMRKEVISLIQQPRKMGLLSLAMLPLVPAYFLLKGVRQAAGQDHLLGYFLLGTALLLIVAHFARRVRIRPGRKRDVPCIGMMQSAALIPGISRSASTIATARVLGWTAREAVTFSFLLAIPTVIGGNVIEMRAFSFSPLILVGFLSSAVFGLISIRFAMKWLESGKFIPFACYCGILGLTLLWIYG